MKKSVYSLVLMDDVVKAVDKQAYLLGTSRSNLINQILAEHLSCVTPEMKMREIFDSISELIGNSFQIQQQRSASLMTIRTALDFKYRPTLNYKVELERIPHERMGTLRVQIRTQNSNLIELFNNFFAYRARLESELISTKGYNDYSFDIISGCFVRKLLNSGLDSEQFGDAVTRYLTHLNKAIQIYFSSPQEFPMYASEIEREYMEMLDTYII